MRKCIVTTEVACILLFILMHDNFSFHFIYSSLSDLLTVFFRCVCHHRLISKKSESERRSSIVAWEGVVDSVPLYQYPYPTHFPQLTGLLLHR